MDQKDLKSPGRPILFLVILMGFGFVFGCDFFSEESIREEQRARIDENKQRWTEQNITDYYLTYRQRANEAVIDSITIFVSARTLDSMSATSSISRENVLVKNVDSFFEQIREKVGNENVLDFAVNFDDSLGYPSRYAATFEDRPDEEIVTLEFGASRNGRGTIEH